ncbi:MAG: hypothetical protein KDE14_16600 [Rhodobacteraceae bacterium]|nr:hypothetical protein [Paracoccaceae bacterium]
MESENKTANTYAKGLPERPDHIMRLPVDGRGYPVPYFASYFDGKPDFRVIDRDKVIATATGKCCTICGGPLNGEAYFAVGPKALILTCATDGPSHKDCIEYAIRTCPFILNPNARARRSGLPEHPAIREQAIPERPPIYGVVSVRGDVKIDNSHITILCSWDQADYRFSKDGKWIEPAEARPFIETAIGELQAEIENGPRPPAIPEEKFESWKAACKTDIKTRAERLLAQIGP